jgi:hypothetical protein
MKYICLSFFLLSCCISKVLKAQNIGVNTTGAAPASTNMFEVLQPSTTAGGVGVYANHSGAVTGAGNYGYAFQAIKTGAGLNNVAAYISATGGTNNYALIVPAGGGRVGFGTDAPLAPFHVTMTHAAAPVIEDVSILGSTATNSARIVTRLSRSGTATDRHVQLHVLQGTTSTTVRSLSLQPDGGNVGIGNIIPGYKLDVTGDGRFSTNLYFGTAGAVLSGGNQGGSIELGPANSAGGEIPFIDFHYGVGAAQDYNVRIINDANGRLNLVGTVRINGAYNLPTADGAANQVLKTDGSGAVTWGNATGVGTRYTFASGTSTTFYSDAYIRFRFDASDATLRFSPQTGHTGYWDIYSIFEYHVDDLYGQNAHSGVEDVNASSTATWYVLQDFYVGEFGGGGTIVMTKENTNAYPIYKLELLQHGTYTTVIVTTY